MPSRSLDLNGTVARASAAVVATDGAGRIALWNPMATTLVGYLPREAIGRLICDIFCPISLRTPTLCYSGCHIGAVSRDAAMQRVDIRTRTKIGRPLGLNVSALVIPGTQGRGPTVMHLLRERVTAAAVPASSNGHSAVGGQPDAALTRREIDVLRLMGAGMNTKAIASVLGVSGATVRNHVQSILGKLAVHSRLAAVAAANRLGLLGDALVNGRP